MFRWTFFNCPAWLYLLLIPTRPGQQEKKLALHMRRDISPTLLVTVYGLDGRSKQLGHLHLGLAQFLASGDEFFAVHGWRWVFFKPD